jgi:ABC-type transport system involved in multi-copper enzyme maturation permease subunit
MSAIIAAVRAEFTKITTMRSVWITTGVILALHLVIQAANLRINADAVAAITPTGTIELYENDPQPAYRALVDFLVASSFQMGVFLPILAVIMAGQEFRGRQLGQSLLAVPRRGRLIVAKTVAIAGFLTLVSVVIAGISTGFLYAATKDWDSGLVTSADAVEGQARFLAFAVLTGLVSVALTVLGRGTLAGVGATVALIALTMTQLVASLTPALDSLLPLSAGRNLLLNPAHNELSAEPGQALVVLIAWPIVALAAAGIALSRRDAR